MMAAACAGELGRCGGREEAALGWAALRFVAVVAELGGEAGPLYSRGKAVERRGAGGGRPAAINGTQGVVERRDA